MPESDSIKTCECGCGVAVRNRFARGHATRGKGRTLAEALREKLMLNEKTGCVEFTGGGSRGYGRVRVGRLQARRVQAHRLAWELEHGPIPSGLVVCHRCDNRICCNVEHLFLGTNLDNCVDMARKGRGRAGGLPYGVGRRPSGRWAARGYRGRGNVHLGTFDSIEEAVAVAAEFRRRALAGELDD